MVPSCGQDAAMTDRLTIINDALIGTGNQPVNVEFDSSAEWQVADSAYRRAVGFLLGRHKWSFATDTADLVSLRPSSPHPVLQYAFDVPGECLHVEQVWRRDTLPAQNVVTYEIIDNAVCCDLQSGLVVKFVRRPSSGQWPDLFIELVTMKVEAYILRGLNEDTDNARRRDAEVEAMLSTARPTLDAQEPARALLNSRSARARMGRGRR
jgi:hypothetical protein